MGISAVYSCLWSAVQLEPLLANHLHADPFDAEVTIDGKVHFDGMTTWVLVGNLGNLPGGLQAFPGASGTDDLLDVAVTTATGRREWTPMIISTPPRAPGSIAARPVRQSRRIVGRWA